MRGRRLTLVALLLGLLLPAGCDEETTDPLVPPVDPGDVTPPSRVTDLGVLESDDHSVTLRWVSPGDDGTQGRASLYDIRWSTDPSVLRGWAEAETLAVPAVPARSGYAETITIDGLEPRTRHWFGLRTADEVGNWSSTSNLAEAVTTCSFSILEPGPAWRICRGDTLTLAWATPDCAGDLVSVHLMREDNVIATIAGNVPNTGELTWVVPGLHVERAAGLRIRILDMETGMSAVSAETEIWERCALWFVDPPAGENYCAFDRVPAAWESSGCCREPLRLEVVRGDSVVATPREGVTEGGYSGWTAVRSGDGSETFRWRLVRMADDETVAESASFTVNAPVPPRILAPNGGEIVADPGRFDVYWENGHCAGAMVQIELLDGAGETVFAVARTQNDGHQTLETPAALDTAGEYRLRVTDLASGLSDVGDGTFTIERVCLMAIEAPVSGTWYCEGEVVPIVWTSEGYCGDLVRIEIRQWSTLVAIPASSITNTGRFDWTVSARGLSYAHDVVVIDRATGTTAVADDALSIHPLCGVTALAPAGDEVFRDGDTYTVRWRVGDCCGDEVQLNLMRYGTVCANLAQGVAARSGVWSWTVEACAGYGDGYRIQVVENGFDRTAMSADFFSIEAPAAP